MTEFSTSRDGFPFEKTVSAPIAAEAVRLRRAAAPAFPDPPLRRAFREARPERPTGSTGGREGRPRRWSARLGTASVVAVHEYRVLESERIHHGWCYDLVAETVVMPGGRERGDDPEAPSERTARREFLDHCGAVVAVPLDEHGRVGLIRQYRVPAKEVLWEFPAGLRDVEGEDPAACAARELAEEADLRAEHWTRLGEFYTTPGISNERIHYFLASGLSRVPEAERHERTDEETHIELVWWDLDKALAAVADGEIRNGVCALALNLARLHLEASK